MSIDLDCEVCTANAAFMVCITCESRDVQAKADYEALTEQDHALADAVWTLQHIRR